MFTDKNLKEHVWTVIRRNAFKLRDMLESKALVENDTQIDMFNIMNRFTLDTIAEIGFGKNIGSLEDPSSPFLQSFDKAQQAVFKRFCVPFWKVLQWLGVGFEKDSHLHVARLNEYSRAVARDLQRSILADSNGSTSSPEQNLASQNSFVGLFVAEAEKQGRKLSEDDLRDLILTFLMAGRTTTASALSWTLFCLCKNPDVQEKARLEVLKVCGDKGPRYEDMSQLWYLQAVINEAMRLYPSIPLGCKVALNDDVLPSGETVPAGTVLWYNIYAMGRDSEIWGVDAEVFRPERWLEVDTPPDNYRYPVFHAGPRECLGKKLALVEIKACFAMLLPQLSFKLAVPAEQIKVDAQLCIGMAQGLPCFVTACPADVRQTSESTSAGSDNIKT
jgi:cytochrome P450